MSIVYVRRIQIVRDTRRTLFAGTHDVETNFVLRTMSLEKSAESILASSPSYSHNVLRRFKSCFKRGNVLRGTNKLRLLIQGNGDSRIVHVGCFEAPEIPIHIPFFVDLNGDFTDVWLLHRILLQKPLNLPPFWVPTLGAETVNPLR